MNYVVSVLPHKMSSESNLDEWHSDNIKCQNEMTIKYLHVFYKPNFHAQVLFFCKMSGELFFDFPLHLVRYICHLICLNIVLLTESDPAVSILINCILLDWLTIMIYRSGKKNSSFRRLKTRKILDKTKIFCKVFYQTALTIPWPKLLQNVNKIKNNFWWARR